MKRPRLVLFDLGGVLVQLGSIRGLWGSKALGQSDAALWKTWLQLEEPRLMDGGKINQREFLERWQARIHPYPTLEELERVYEQLIQAPFPGALELVGDLRTKVEVGCLSNMNSCHWPQVLALGFEGVFDRVFASHLIGHAKPSDEIFQHVLMNVPHKPEEILFLDDNQLNVDVARKHGFNAKLISGVEGARKVLAAYF